MLSGLTAQGEVRRKTSEAFLAPHGPFPKGRAFDSCVVRPSPILPEHLFSSLAVRLFVVFYAGLYVQIPS